MTYQVLILLIYLLENLRSLNNLTIRIPSVNIETSNDDTDIPINSLVSDSLLENELNRIVNDLINRVINRSVLNNGTEISEDNSFLSFDTNVNNKMYDEAYVVEENEHVTSESEEDSISETIININRRLTVLENSCLNNFYKFFIIIIRF